MLLARLRCTQRFSCSGSLQRLAPAGLRQNDHSIDISHITKRCFSGNGTETHGGDDVHRVSKLVCDFSVTTNCLGPVPDAVQATRRLLDAMSEDTFSTPIGGDIKAILDEHGEHVFSSPAIEHYPVREDSQLTKLAAEFFRKDADATAVADLEDSLIFGNGASELIDLLARAAPKGSFCTNPFTKTQYREYERGCLNAGRQRAEKCEDAAVLCVVNPTNPTGDFVERVEMENWISNTAAPGSWVVVDESMLFWAGPNWHERGVSREFVGKMLAKDVKIFLVYSWTKIFSCTGLRIGSVICPSKEAQQNLEAMQVPWSVNIMARTYLKAALQDTDYLERTWRLTALWREHTISKLKRLHPTWQFLGQPWTSWVWIETGDEQVAQAVYQASLDCGCPVRHASAGYGFPTIIRIAVRRPEDFAVLYQALLHEAYHSTSNTGDKPKPFGTYADVDPTVVDGVHLVHVDDLKPHLHEGAKLEGGLEAYVKDMPILTLPAIIVDSQYQVVIDGHHRLAMFRRAGMNIIPAVFVNYDHPDILATPPSFQNKVSKETVIFNALKGQLLPNDATEHMVRSSNGKLLPISVLAPQIAEIR